MPSGFNMDDLDRAAFFCLACVMYVGTGRLGFYFSHAIDGDGKYFRAKFCTEPAAYTAAPVNCSLH